MERSPKHVIKKENSFLTVDDAKNWDRGFMSRFRNYQGGITEVTQDIQADQINITVNEGNHYPAFVSWDQFDTGNYSSRDMYISAFGAIGNLNSIFDQIGSLKVKEEDKAVIDVVIGRMHFLRAYYYFELSLRFGERYNKATAAQDLNVPLLLTYDPGFLPQRATNEQVYTQILKDINEAKTLLAKEAGKPMSIEITLDAVKALEARVKFYMKDYEGALPIASELITDNKYPLVKAEQKSFEDMWLNDKSTEEILQLFVARPDELISINPYFGAVTDKVRSDGSKGVNAPSYLPTQWMIDLYADEDLRKDVYFELQECNFKDQFYNLYLISKRKGNPKHAKTINPKFSFWGGYLPNSMHAPKVFRIAEQYLIAAESAFETDDPVAAKNFLKSLQESRGLAFNDALAGDALRDEIRNERTRELAYEGFRLWDLRRWDMPVRRHDPQMVGDAAYLKGLSHTFSYEADDFRFVWPIPANDMNTNPNIQRNNPGWN